MSGAVSERYQVEAVLRKSSNGRGGSNLATEHDLERLVVMGAHTRDGQRADVALNVDPSRWRVRYTEDGPVLVVELPVDRAHLRFRPDPGRVCDEGGAS